jgi:hypothetical protein
MCNVGHSKHETCYVITVTVGPGGSRLRLPSQVPTSHSDERETDDLVKLLKSKRPSSRVLVAAHYSVEHKGSSVSQLFESDRREQITARSVSGSDKML